MYSPQPMPVQVVPQRQFGVRDFITGIIFFLVGVAILIGFFGLPFLDPYRAQKAGVAESQFTANRLIQGASRRLNVSDFLDDTPNSRFIFDRIMPHYVLYIFVGIAILYFWGALLSIFKAIFRGERRVGFFAGILRIIIVSIFYIALPLAVIIFFYAFASGLYDLTDVISRQRIFRLDVVQQFINRIPPGMGVTVMLGASIFGAFIAILSTIAGMFMRSRPQVFVVQQSPYGMSTYPPQTPYSTPPYQQPPMQNPYGIPPSQPPFYQRPPTQSPIDWGDKPKPNDKF